MQGSESKERGCVVLGASLLQLMDVLQALVLTNGMGGEHYAGKCIPRMRRMNRILAERGQREGRKLQGVS